MRTSFRNGLRLVGKETGPLFLRQSGAFQLDTVNSMSLSYKWADQSTGTGRAGSNRSGIHGKDHAHHRIHAAGTSVHDGIAEYPGRISVPFAATDMIWPCTATPASS